MLWRRQVGGYITMYKEDNYQYEPTGVLIVFS